MISVINDPFRSLTRTRKEKLLTNLYDFSFAMFQVTSIMNSKFSMTLFKTAFLDFAWTQRNQTITTTNNKQSKSKTVHFPSTHPLFPVNRQVYFISLIRCMLKSRGNNFSHLCLIFPLWTNFFVL